MQYLALRIRPTMCPTYEIFLGKRMRKAVSDEGHKPKLPMAPSDVEGRASPPTPDGLRLRRERVLELAQSGKGRAEIAAALDVPRHTVRNDMHNLRVAGRL